MTARPVRVATHGRNGNGVPRCWQAQKPFTTAGAIRGDWFDSMPETGRMPDEYVRLMRAALARYGRLFVVFSYGTPIGWRNGDYSCRPDARYSVTTSRHQGMLWG